MAGDRLALMIAIIEPHSEVPPVVDQRYEVRHQQAEGEFCVAKPFRPIDFFSARNGG
jgi:hypothetical protein